MNISSVSRSFGTFVLLTTAAVACDKSEPTSTTKPTAAQAELARDIASAIEKAASASGPAGAAPGAAAAHVTFAKLPLAGTFKGLTIDAPQGSTFEADSDMVKNGEHFALTISKGKVDLADQKKQVQRDLREVNIVAEDANGFIYEFASIGKNYGFRANVKVGKDNYWCMSDFGFYERADMDAMRKSCDSLAKAGK